MFSDIKLYNVAENKGRGRAVSKTARNFTGDNLGYDLPDAICVSLDWLSFMCDSGLAEPAKDEVVRVLNDDWVLENQQKGATNFNHMWKAYYGGEHVANVLAGGKNPTIIKAGIVKIEIMNQVLYSTSTLEIMQGVMAATSSTRIRNFTRIDISIDGCEHVHVFLNEYIRQRDRRKDNGLVKLGKWDEENRVRMKGKANLDPKRFNRSTGYCDNFKIGSAKKNFVLYNKTSELQHSHKEYIRDAWQHAGLDVNKTIWRCELRMNSEAIKEFKDFEVQRITDPNYLLQLFKTSAENFFHFVINDDSNISRCTTIDLFQFEKLKIPLLEKIPRAIVRGAYKAKMAIHNSFQNLCIGVIETREKIETTIQYIADNLNLYNLHRWYENHKYQWLEKYSPIPAFT